MPDPFLDVDAADPGLIAMMAQSLENRGVDPQMTSIVDRYLAAIEGSRQIVEIGAGTGAIARRIAATFPEAHVVAIEPSEALVKTAREKQGAQSNLRFTVAPGEATGLSDRSADAIIMHTVLSHVPDPALLLTEAFRVLRPGGSLVVCDADFSKLSMGNRDGDPLDACARTFLREFVVDPYVCAKLRPLVSAAGFALTRLTVDNRLDLGESETGGGLSWVLMSTKHLTAGGVIGEELAAALLGEYRRRVANRTVYGFNPIVTLIARRGDG